MNDIGLMLADKNDYYVDGFGSLPPITISDFMHMGEDYEKYHDKLIMPWRICIRSFYTEKEYSKLIESFADICDYDIFFIYLNDEQISINIDGVNCSILKLLEDSIKFMFKKDVVVDFENQNILFGEYIINKNNFEEIRNIILKTNCSELYKIQDVPNFENERQRDIFIKLQEGRKRRADLNKLTIKQILNIVLVYTKYQINDVIKNMTLYQLFNTYSSMSYEDGYKTNLKWVSVVADLKKLDLEHWSTKLK